MKAAVLDIKQVEVHRNTPQLTAVAQADQARLVRIVGC